MLSQGETARLARLDGGACSLFSYLLSVGNTNHTRIRTSTGCLAIRIRRTRGQQETMAQTECEQTLLGKLSRGRHQPTEMVAFIQTFTAHPKWTSALRLLCRVSGGAETMPNVHAASMAARCRHDTWSNFQRTHQPESDTAHYC